MRSRYLALATGAVVAMAVVTAAAIAFDPAPVTGSGPQVAPDRSVQPRDVAVDNPRDLPLETYMPDYSLYTAAVGDVIQDCMADAEQAYPTSEWDITISPEPRAYTDLGYISLSAETAAEFGYRDRPDPRRLGPPRGFDPADPAKHQRARQRCTDASVELIPDFARSANFIADLDSASRREADADPSVLAAVERWQRCVEPQLLDGMPVPANPEEFRLSVLTRMDEAHHPTEPDTMTVAPSPEESRIAEADAECRERSGYNKTYFGAIARHQSDQLDQHADRLASIRRELGIIERKITETLG